MAEKPRVAIVGAGNLGTAVARTLHRAGYIVDVVLAHSTGNSLRKAKRLAKEVGARAAIDPSTLTGADVVWLCVPDVVIAEVARALAKELDWRRKVALHSSGALASDELTALRQQGASVASVHPLMTFVRGSSFGRSSLAGSRPSLAGVPFALEGEARALRIARQIVRDLGGTAYSVRRKDKAAYHAWGTFASPLLVALLATTEQVAVDAGVNRAAARQRMIPILLQTLANYASFGAAGAFSGPIVRGDVDTVKRHLRALGQIPAARAVYVTLARASLLYLPAKNRGSLRKALDSRSH